MLDTIAENSSKLSLPSLREPSVSMLETGSQRNRYVPVLISLHNRLIDNLLQLRILTTHESNSNSKGDLTQGARGYRTLRLFPTIILSTRKSSPLEIYPSRSISYTLNATVHEISSSVVTESRAQKERYEISEDTHSAASPPSHLDY